MVKQEELAEETNVLPFARLKTAGKGPTVEDWLSRLKVGTAFLARPKQFNGFNLVEFVRGGQKGSAVLIVENNKNVETEFVWVDPIRFSQTFELYAILEEPD